MKNPILIFTSIAAVSAAALGATLYVSRVPEAPKQIAATAEPVKKPEVVAKVETAPAPPAQKRAVATPAPVVVAPAAPEKTPEVAVVPAPAKPVVIAPVPVPKVAVAAPAPVVPDAGPALPAFDTVRVEATGDAVIAGRAAPDSDVTVKWNGNIVGTAKANADGSFVLVPAKALKTGIGAMTIEMNKGGQIITSEGSVFVVVKKDGPATVAKVDAVAPTQVVQSAAVVATPKDLQLTAVDYDTAGNIVFSGVAAAGSTVRFYVDNAATGEGSSDAAGKWSFAGTSSVKPGTHMLRADAVDAGGKVISRIELPFLRESVEAVAAAQVATAAPVVPVAPAAPVSRSVAPAAPVALTTVPEAPAVVAPEPPATQVAVAPAAPAVDAGPKKLVIQPGNNLWKLSREVYGKGRMFTIIYEANRDQVKNPNRIYPGQILTAPKHN